MRGLPRRSHAVERRVRRSSHRTGQQRVAARRRSPPRSMRHAKRRPSSASPRRSRTSSGRSRSGTRFRMRPSSPGSTSPSSAPGRPSSPAKSVLPHARSSSAGERSRSVGEGDPHRAALLHVRLGEYLEQTGSEVRLPRRVSSVRSSLCRRSHPHRSGRMRWRHSRGRCVCSGAMRSRCRSANRRSRSLGTSAQARRRSERSRCVAPTSPTSAAATRVSPIFVRPCSSPRRSAIAWAWSGHGSISPTC